jgi:GR25 family glycosyltransferase involved in LPS biosynthesis
VRLNVINLPARADRRAQFNAWNERAGLEIAYVDAAIGAELDRAQLIRDGLLANENGTFTPGALGNALSHHALWRAAQSDSGPTFVCEDDACLRGDFAEKAAALLAQLPSTWDLVFLGYNTNATAAVQSGEGIKTLLWFDDAAKKAPGFFDAYARSTAPGPTPLACFQAWGTLCYAISPAGAAHLLKACFPLSSAPDLAMFGQNRRIKPYTLDGMINVALQREPVAAYCAYPPLALSANDLAGSDVVTR